MGNFEIQLTPSAKAEAAAQAKTGKCLRISIGRSGCCGYAVTVRPDFPREGDATFQCDGITFLRSDNYADLNWWGILDYKPKGLRRGYVWI